MLKVAPLTPFSELGQEQDDVVRFAPLLVTRRAKELHVLLSRRLGVDTERASRELLTQVQGPPLEL